MTSSSFWFFSDVSSPCIFTYPPRGNKESEYRVSPMLNENSLGPKPIEKSSTLTFAHLAASRWPSSWIKIKKLIIRITDNGLGISKKHLPRLFERFYRVDKSGNRKKGGSGLGLSIVKHIIEAHQEKIYVESTEGMGSEFSFTLQKA